MRDTFDGALSFSRGQKPFDHMQYLSDQHIGSYLIVFILGPIDNCVSDWRNKRIDISIVKYNFWVMSIGFADFLDIIDLVLYFFLHWRFFSCSDDVDKVLIHLRILFDFSNIVQHKIIFEITFAGVQHQRFVLN